MSSNGIWLTVKTKTRNFEVMYLVSFRECQSEKMHENEKLKLNENCYGPMKYYL